MAMIDRRAFILRDLNRGGHPLPRGASQAHARVGQREARETGAKAYTVVFTGRKAGQD